MKSIALLSCALLLKVYVHLHFTCITGICRGYSLLLLLCKKSASKLSSEPRHRPPKDAQHFFLLSLLTEGGYIIQSSSFSALQCLCLSCTLFILCLVTLVQRQGEQCQAVPVSAAGPTGAWHAWLRELPLVFQRAWN